MPVITIDTEISFDVADIEDDVIEREVKRRSALLRNIEDELREKFEPDITAFSTTDLLAELESREAEIDRPWLERCYRLIAEGRNDEAMELIYAESGEGLAPPYTEKRTADLLSGKRKSVHAEN